MLKKASPLAQTRLQLQVCVMFDLVSGVRRGFKACHGPHLIMSSQSSAQFREKSLATETKHFLFLKGAVTVLFTLGALEIPGCAAASLQRRWQGAL